MGKVKLLKSGSGSGTGSTIGVTYNEDGTQNIIIGDNGNIVDLAALTADADATTNDIANGKIAYINGQRVIGTVIDAEEVGY